MKTVEEFDKWTTQLLLNYGNKGGESATHLLVVMALQTAYDEGYTLGYRDAIEVQEEREEWYEAIDGDQVEQDRLNNPNIAQKKDKASGCYVAYYVATGIEIGRRCGGQPFKNITIVE